MDTFLDKLKEIKELANSKLITNEEYSKLRAEILEEYDSTLFKKRN